MIGLKRKKREEVITLLSTILDVQTGTSTVLVQISSPNNNFYLTNSFAALFESMRKEQHKAFQESQKSNPVKQRDEFDILMQLDESKNDEKLMNTSIGLEESISLQTSKSDREKSFPSQTTVSRPLVPPGFTSTVLEKNFGTRSSVNPHLLEVIFCFLFFCFGSNRLFFVMTQQASIVGMYLYGVQRVFFVSMCLVRYSHDK